MDAAAQHIEFADRHQPSYKNCTEAHKDGRYNIPKGDPDYRPKLSVGTSLWLTIGQTAKYCGVARAEVYYKMLGALEVRRIGLRGGVMPFGRLIRVERGSLPRLRGRIRSAVAGASSLGYSAPTDGGLVVTSVSQLIEKSPVGADRLSGNRVA